jgi:hypothetical protein
VFDAASEDDDCRLMVVRQEEKELRGVAVVEKASAEDDAASKVAKAPIDFIMVDLRSIAYVCTVSCWRSIVVTTQAGIK